MRLPWPSQKSTAFWTQSFRFESRVHPIEALLCLLRWVLFSMFSRSTSSMAAILLTSVGSSTTDRLFRERRVLLSLLFPREPSLVLADFFLIRLVLSSFFSPSPSSQMSIVETPGCQTFRSRLCRRDGRGDCPSVLTRILRFRFGLGDFVRFQFQARSMTLTRGESASKDSKRFRMVLS